MEEYQEIERSIIKKYRKEIWSRFIRAVNDYHLIGDQDKLMVCISGGKDSFLMAKCIQELKRHGKISFDAIYVVMNPGYSEANLQQIQKNAEILHIPIEIFETDIFGVVSSLQEGHPCYLCARMRRGHLYNYAKEHGCNKICLGHHFDDVIETTLLSMFYGSEVKTMLPKLHSEHFAGVDLIRPLYLIRESAILAWKNFHGLQFLNCACRFAENCSLTNDDSKRLLMKKLITELRKINPDIDYNLFKSLDNINLNCVLGYKKDGVYHSYYDDFDS